MIETSKHQERVILLGVELPDTENFEMSMEELASLAETAGAEVVSSYRQKREKYDSKSLIGSGKLAEIKAIVDADAIDTVIVNDRLTPRQNVNLEAELGVKVIDRMQLILDIFAMRARSHEGKLQVHLAQLKYMLPRLVGQGVMLSRQAGGIGSRGPGESQLELNRRSIRNQISDIERQLKIVAEGPLVAVATTEAAAVEISRNGFAEVRVVISVTGVVVTPFLIPLGVGCEDTNSRA